MRRLGRLQRHRDMSRGSTGEIDRRVRYGGAWFRAASTLPLTRGALSRRLDRLVRRRDQADPSSQAESGHVRYLAALFSAAQALGMVAVLLAGGVCRPRRTAALLGLLVRTQSETLSFSDSDAGQTLSEHFRRSCFGFLPLNRFCRGVLILPERYADYICQRRKAVRRNLRRAVAAGITCEPIAERGRAAELLTRMSTRRQSPMTAEYTARWRATVDRPETELFVARDRSGDPLAVAGIVIDETVGLFRFAMASSYEARWALHDHVVRVLIDRQVRYLVTEGDGAFGALGYSASVQYYQHLHGYELRHLKPRARPRTGRRNSSAPPT